MKAIACLLAMTAIAGADPEADEPRMSFGLGAAVAVERNLDALWNVQLGWRLRSKYWIEAAAGFGAASLLDPAGSGQTGSRAYEGRLGVARIACGRIACTGLGGSFGYHHQSIDFDDGLVQPPMWTETRDLGFAELRGLARVRMFAGRIALEGSLAARVYQAFHVEHAEGGINAGVVASVGLHATL